MVWRLGLLSLDNNCIFWTAKPLKRGRKDAFSATHPWHGDVLSDPCGSSTQFGCEREPWFLPFPSWSLGLVQMTLNKMKADYGSRCCGATYPAPERVDPWRRCQRTLVKEGWEGRLNKTTAKLPHFMLRPQHSNVRAVQAR